MAHKNKETEIFDEAREALLNCLGDYTGKGANDPETWDVMEVLAYDLWRGLQLPGEWGDFLRAVVVVGRTERATPFYSPQAAAIDDILEILSDFDTAPGAIETLARLVSDLDDALRKSNEKMCVPEGRSGEGL